MSRFLTLPEAAERLRLGKSTVYHLTSSRQIPFYKIGAKLLFSEEDLNGWLMDRKVELIASQAIQGGRR